MEKVYTRLELFQIVQESNGRTIDEKLQFLDRKLCEISKCQGDGDISAIKKCLIDFRYFFKRYWCLAQRKEDRFLSKYAKWLEGTVTIPVFGSSSSGRPQKEFNEASERTKRRKTEEIRHQLTTEEITFAASMSQRSAGNNDAAKLIMDVTRSPRKARICKRSLTTSEVNPVNKLSAEGALALFVNAELTKKQYEILYNANKNVYPCYSLLKNAKKNCYPSEDAITVTETLAEVKLQSLLDHTSTRLCEYLDEVLQQLDYEELHFLELISKWGCDGSHQSCYKQKFKNENDSDTNIFQSSCVPIKLITNANGKIKTIWRNPTPSSTRLCRPIRIRFVRESTDITKQEIGYINNQIQLLKKSEVPCNGSIAKIKHTMLLTMVDGKVCNAATDTKSTMRCYICGQTSKDFNTLQKNIPQNPDALNFGLSTLHARIRFLESILHLSYKLTIRKWQIRSDEEKALVKERKAIIQKRLKDEMGLLVDVPKPGYGNTNDGNASRRFFSDPVTVSKITGINEELLKRLNIILEAITSGHRINIEKFEEYAHKTAEMYVQLYNWHPMSPTMHKILIHGGTVIKQAILPIGQLSEEAAEARNKHFRLYRTNYARKFSRSDTNRDVLNRLLLSSDPFLSCSTQKTPKNRKPFSSDTIKLLLPDTDDAVHDEIHDNDFE